MQRELWKHLRDDGKLIAYFRYLFGVHKRTIAFVFVTLITLLSITYVQRNAILREERAQIRTCERVQILRDQTNGLSFIAYDAWAGAAMREKRLAEATKGREHAQHQKSYVGLQTLADKMVITGPTDCSRATSEPDRYEAPAPEFIGAKGPNVELSRRRSQTIIEKAKKNEPLYKPLPTDRHPK